MEEFFTGFWTTLATVFLSEIGDKSFIILAMLCQKEKTSAVIVGNQIGLTPLIILAAYAGKLATLLPVFYINAASSFSFFVFSLISFCDAFKNLNKMEEELKDSEKLEPLINDRTWVRTVGMISVIVFFSEWGDMSQFTTISLALIFSTESVIFGASLAMFLSAIIALFVGKTFGKYIKASYANFFSGCLFMGFSLYAGYLTLNDL